MFSLFVILSLFLYSLESSCIAYGSGVNWDLSSLSGTTVKAAGGGWNYEVSVCATSVSCGNTGDCGTTGICQTQNDDAYCIGNYQGIAGPISASQDGVVISYSGGQGARSGIVTVACNPSATTPTNIAATNTNDTITGYLVSFEHASACVKAGSGRGLSGGSICIILFIVGVVVYLAAGIAFNAIKNGERGLQMIPQFEFWSVFPYLVVDGVKFIISKIQGLRAGGYE